MRFLHFYHHRLLAHDKFTIWQFNEAPQRHRVKSVENVHHVTCHCTSDESVVCTDLNYIADKWATAPVMAHGLVASAPPSWRKIEVGKYVRVEQLFQAATFAVMIGGAIILHYASTNCMSSGANKAVSQKPSRPMSIQEISNMADVPPSQLAPADATVVEVQNESVATFDLNTSVNFNEVSASAHSLSGMAEEVESTFVNCLTIAEDVESEILASMHNDTFSESMLRPRPISISDAGGEFSDPLTKQFVSNVDRGKEFFQRVLVNEPQLPQSTKDLVQDVLHMIEYKNGVLDAGQSKYVIDMLEKELGGFKLFQNYTGSAKPPLPPKIVKELQFYQGLMHTTKIGSIVQTNVDVSFSTEWTEMKREFLLQTSLDVDLMKVATIQRLPYAYQMPKFKFNRANSPFIGHSCLVFDIIDNSLKSLPAGVSMTMLIGANAYLVRDIYDQTLWVYCDRSKLKEAAENAAKSNDFVLVPQRRRQYVFWMHVDATFTTPAPQSFEPVQQDTGAVHSIKPHQDAQAYLKASGHIWLIKNGRERNLLSNFEEKYTLRTKSIMLSPFQFNGIEALESRGDVFRLPPICTLLPFSHYQVSAFNSDFEVVHSVTTAIDYKLQSNVYGFLCGHDYIDVTNETIKQRLKDINCPNMYKTITFFSTYDYEPVRIRKITFNRPWVIYATFYYMTIELECGHGISWSKWSKRKEDGYGLNPSFTMDIIGEAAEKHLHVQHRCRLKIHEVKNDTTLVFKTPLKGDESKIPPDVYATAKLGFPIDENMSALMIHQREKERAMQPMCC